MNYKYTFRYALIGALFGLLFPFFATIIETLSSGLPLTLGNIVLIQSKNPLLWIINTAPIFLGLFSGFAGIRQDRLAQQNSKLESEILARNYAYEELEQLKNSLDRKVKERTKSLEKKVIQLSASSDVGQALAAMRDLDSLLSEVTVLISDYFHFNHTAIFLLDDRGEFALLKAASSEGGKRMLARGHKLKVGGSSIVGNVTKLRKARIAQNVGADAVYFDNPDMPDTRSEMTLPLISGDEILGALDIQSEKEGIFDLDDIEVLQALANQVAVAIENSILFAENQTSIDSIQKAYGEISHQAWQKIFAQSELGFISSETVDIQSAELDWSPKMLETANSGQINHIDDKTIHIPIILRGQTIGVVRLRKREGTGSWSNEDVMFMATLVDQLESALESARLYSDTQKQAERQRLIHEITDKLHRSLDIDTLMQTLLQEISIALGSSGTFVQLSTETDTSKPINNKTTSFN